ncbi:glutathione S-transferase [Rubricella aquisinus]|uniref:Glutathione S-transferase n=1 Tax=Rubricella aquisinus TaxID=2028108 RepID=A0A840WXI0_9RHOB|nr:glutathione S-transferase family protein [Rubricella aquisinus]MBB5515880.1 glutathione S-transferase [Rubricella aquisinus]
MILYGRDLSPFARRVAIWCDLQDRPVERRKIMVSGPEWEELKAVNPVGRVPALVLDDGTVLTESFAIIDWLEETAPAHQRLLPESGVARRAALQIVAMAHSTSEKAVALVYERIRRPEELHWGDWIARVEGQITAGLAELEAHCPAEGWFFGAGGPNGADISAVIAYDLVNAVHGHLLKPGYPKLAALSAMANDIPAFAKSRPAA